MIKIDRFLNDDLKNKASTSIRRRYNYNFHDKASDTLQRMLNVLNKDTYVKPHKHENPDKREIFIILEGKAAIIEFDVSGHPTDFIILSHVTGKYGCEIAPRTWHTIVCLENNTVLYEVKDGPYSVDTDKIFATWAPDEGDPAAQEFNLALIRNLKI